MKLRTYLSVGGLRESKVKLKKQAQTHFVERNLILCSPACNSLQYDFLRMPCLYIFRFIDENHVCGKNNNSQTILPSLQN